MEGYDRRRVVWLDSRLDWLKDRIRLPIDCYSDIRDIHLMTYTWLERGSMKSMFVMLSIQEFTQMLNDTDQEWSKLCIVTIGASEETMENLEENLDAKSLSDVQI